jgi:predicted branched-subunit amino acid permease
LFGVVVREAGLNLIETMTMTILVISGALEFTALAVNLRITMYSAVLVPYFGKASLSKRLLASYFMVDQTFAVAIKRYDSDPTLTLDQKLNYYFGCAAGVCPFCYSYFALSR